MKTTMIPGGSTPSVPLTVRSFRKPLVSRFFTIFTFVSGSFHDFHAKKTPSNFSIPSRSPNTNTLSLQKNTLPTPKRAARSRLPKIVDFPSQVPAIINSNLSSSIPATRCTERVPLDNPFRLTPFPSSLYSYPSLCSFLATILAGPLPILASRFGIWFLVFRSASITGSFWLRLCRAGSLCLCVRSSLPVFVLTPRPQISCYSRITEATVLRSIAYHSLPLTR